MTISFNNIPPNIRVPFLYFEVNAGQAPYQNLQRLLLVGQKTSSGTATANQPVIVSSGEDGLFGVGSMLARMYKIARRNAPFQEIWCLPIDDAGGSVSATATITIGGAPAAQNGTLAFYLDGQVVRVPIRTTDTNNTIATAVAAAFNAAVPALPVTASATAAVVTLTARNKGALGNDLRVDTNVMIDDVTPQNLTITTTAFSNGATDPTLTTAITNLGSEPFEWIASPYADSTSMAAFQALLDDRWGPYQQLFGHYLTADVGSLSTLTTFGATQNSPRTTILGVRNFNSHVASIAAALGAQCAAHLQAAPELSRPLQTLQLLGIMGPKAVSDRWTITERNSLYYSGISAVTVDRVGAVQLDRVITTYRTNQFGQQDSTWLDINTIAQIQYGLRYLGQKLATTWGRAALVDRNSAGLQNFADAASIADTIIHGYNELVLEGVFENPDLFAQLLIVERNATDANRVDAYLPLDVVNQLRILAVNATTYLQYPTAA